MASPSSVKSASLTLDCHCLLLTKTIAYALCFICRDGRSHVVRQALPAGWPCVTSWSGMPEAREGWQMRGEVLHYDEAQGFGFITGADGNRYTFRARESAPRSVGGQGRGRRIPTGRRPGARRLFDLRPDRHSGRRRCRRDRCTTSAGTHACGRAQPQHFGRFAEIEPDETTGLWGYFWRGLTRELRQLRRPRAPQGVLGLLPVLDDR